MSTVFDAETFFATQHPPPRLDQDLEAVQRFVQKHASEGRRIVLVTSGGTTVPLEQNVVRFLDNFSAGTRGSSSAEYFLRTGRYAVIFLHRQHSLQPFSRHYSHSTNPFLDLLEIVDDDERPATSTNPLFASPTTFQNPLHSSSATNGISVEAPSADPLPEVRVAAKHSAPMRSLLRSYQRVQDLGLLHRVAFVTVFDYLFLLRGIAQVIGRMRDPQGASIARRSMYYLAAAVSDFFVPQQKMSEHKIQSVKGSLSIEMDGVPKILRTLVDDWSDGAFVVSFKLETDMNLLVPKARQALERYGHTLVIANELHRRKTEVVFVRAESEEVISLSEDLVAQGREIEEPIIDRLVALHDEHIDLPPAIPARVKNAS